MRFGKLRRWMSRGPSPASAPRDSESVELRHVARETEDLIPRSDYVWETYDDDLGVKPERLLVVLSTPRSGSTLLCSLLARAELCLAHEYLHHWTYLPLLARRWGCDRDGILDVPAYARALERYRTSAKGVLGIKVHGEELRLYERVLPHFSTQRVDYVWLRRGDVMRQAVSYAMAVQTLHWTSDFAARSEPRYDYDLFVNRLNDIHAQEDLIAAFLHEQGVEPIGMRYEELVADPETTLAPLNVVPPSAEGGRLPSHLSRQSDRRNADFLARFARDHWERARIDSGRMG